MKTFLTHAKTTAKMFGGKPEDYFEIHQWLDKTEELIQDFKHQILRHHTQGIFMAEEKFGFVIQNSDGKNVAVRTICEIHIKDDLGFIPTLQEWLNHMSIEKWMGNRNIHLNKRFKETQHSGKQSLSKMISENNLNNSSNKTLS